MAEYIGRDSAIELFYNDDADVCECDGWRCNMTRDDAIDGLLAIRDYVHRKTTSEVIDIAIIALKQPEIVSRKNCKRDGECGIKLMLIAEGCQEEIFCSSGEKKDNRK